MDSSKKIKVEITTNKKNYTIEDLIGELEDPTQRARSRIKWRKLTGERQEAFSCLVSALLKQMNDSIEDWLPESLSHTQSKQQVIDVSFKLFLSDLDIIAAEQAYLENTRRERAIESLAEILEKDN